MHVRKIKIDDYEQVLALQKQIYKLHLKNRPDVYINVKNPFNFEYFVEQLNSENTLNFVCVDNDKILGLLLANYKKHSKAPFIKKRKIIYIDSFVVDKKYRNMGIGKRLFLHLEKLAKKENVESIELNVWAFNEPAIDVYQALGLTPKSIHFEKKI